MHVSENPGYLRKPGFSARAAFLHKNPENPGFLEKTWVFWKICTKTRETPGFLENSGFLLKNFERKPKFLGFCAKKLP